MFSIVSFSLYRAAMKRSSEKIAGLGGGGIVESVSSLCEKKCPYEMTESDPPPYNSYILRSTSCDGFYAMAYFASVRNDETALKNRQTSLPPRPGRNDDRNNGVVFV